MNRLNDFNFLKGSIDKELKQIGLEFNSLKKENETLRKINSELKSEHYENDELKEMSAELNRMKSNYYRGFPITENEEMNIKAWKKDHDENVHGLDTLEKKLKAGGCIGGRYHYEFIPTSIGTVGIVKCSCGASYEFQSL